VIWGGIHGAWLSLERLLWMSVGVLSWFRRIVTLGIIGVTWIFFRAKSLGAALEMLRNLAHFQWQRQYSSEMLFLAVISGAMMLIDWRLERYDEEYVFQKAYLSAPVVACGIMTVLMVLFAASETNAFIYFQF
jgi:hypothetical protein